MSVWVVCVCISLCKDSYGRDQGSSGGGEEDCQWRTAGKYLGPSAHGQNRAVSLVQPPTGRSRREVPRLHNHTWRETDTFSLMEVWIFLPRNNVLLITISQSVWLSQWTSNRMLLKSVWYNSRLLTTEVSGF